MQTNDEVIKQMNAKEEPEDIKLQESWVNANNAQNARDLAESMLEVEDEVQDETKEGARPCLEEPGSSQIEPNSFGAGRSQQGRLGF